MSNTQQQPEALRLADALVRAINQTDLEDDVIHVARWFVNDAAAELRRLYEENERLNVENRRLIDRAETFGVPVGVGGFATTTTSPTMAKATGGAV